MFRYYWDRDKMVNLMTVAKVDRCFHLRKGDADAIAYETDKPSGRPHIVVAECSRLSQPSPEFITDTLDDFVRDNRRISIKFGQEKDGVALIRTAVHDLKEAAQFVLADMSATGDEWVEIKA